MAISYAPDAITITDEIGDRPPVVLPIDAFPEEVEQAAAAYHRANLPEPQWMEFGIDLAMHPGIIALYGAIPGPMANGLSIGLNEAGKGDPRLFTGLWQRVMAAGAIQPNLLSDIAALAALHNLPAEFLAALRPAQAG
jgi:hypothetical protein